MGWDCEETVPGENLVELMNGDHADRAVFLSTMEWDQSLLPICCVRGDISWSLYSDYKPQLFYLQDDPEELRDIAEDPSSKAVLESLIAELNKICDPLDTDKRAKRCQADMVEAVGGRQFAMHRGDLGFSVPPGLAPRFD